MAKTSKSKTLIEQYDKICNEIVQKFANKQWGWIGNTIGGIADFNESYTYGFDDIVEDLRTNQPKGFIEQWQEEGFDFNHKSEEIKFINYKSYINLKVLQKKYSESICHTLKLLKL